MYHIVQLKKQSTLNQIALVRKIKLLPSLSTGESKKLSGYTNIFRLRVGDYRIVYRKTSSEIYIVSIGHRKDIDEIISRLSD